MQELPFSRVFCVPNARLQDSARMRRRLGVYCRDSLQGHASDIANLLEGELGVTISWYGTNTLPVFFRDAEVRDVLDAITYIFRLLRAMKFHQAAESWQQYATRVLAEEHTSYVVTETCAVTYAVDEVYASMRTATLAGLDDPRWSEARAEFERAFEALDRDTPDTNGAIRAIAASVESAAKVMLQGAASRVGPAEIEKHLAPLVRSRYQGDAAATNASQQMLKSYADWVNATHQYRHGQGAPHEGHAPLELTISLLSSGSSTLRWLIELNDSVVARPHTVATA